MDLEEVVDAIWEVIEGEDLDEWERGSLLDAIDVLESL